MGHDALKEHLKYDADRFAPVQQYAPRTGILRLGLESVGKGGVRVTSRSQLEQVATFTFSPSVPLALSANLGASEAELDLGGLTLTELTVRSGASRGTVDFSKPTQGECLHASFNLGATELTVRNLANAACAEVRIEGGVGRATLDFGGAWRRDTRLSVDLSMGASRSASRAHRRAAADLPVHEPTSCRRAREARQDMGNARVRECRTQAGRRAEDGGCGGECGVD